MAFVKVGDPTPIKGFYDENLELKVCDKCGKPLTVVALDGENNDVLCKCGTEDEESSQDS